MRRTLPIAICALLLLGGRGAGAQEAAGYDPFPKMDRVVGVLYDLGAVVPELRRLPDLRMRGRAAFDLWYGPSGGLDSIGWSDEASARQPGADRLLALLRAHARPFVPSDNGWRVGFAVATGRRASLGLSREEPPRLLDPGSLEAGLRGVCDERPALCSAAGDRTVVVGVTVDPRGHPGPVRVSAPGGGEALGAEAERIARGLRFRPATVEGRPARREVVLPVTIGFP